MGDDLNAPPGEHKRGDLLSSAVSRPLRPPGTRMRRPRTWGRVLRLGMMLVLRYTPLPWELKRRAIWQAMPKVVVIGVAVIPDAEGRVLMVRARYSGLWLLPGGNLEAREDPLNGTLRECQEELGAVVTVEDLTGIYTDPAHREIFFAFRCAPLTQPPVLSEEHEAWQYVPPYEARPPVNMIAADALAGSCGVRVARLT